MGTTSTRLVKSVDLAGYLRSRIEPFRRKLHEFRMRPTARRLEEAQGHQRETFRRLAGAFAARYKALRGDDLSQFTTGMWNEYLARLEEAMLPAPPFDFQRDPTISGSMVFVPPPSLTRRELRVVQKTLPKEILPGLLEEDLVGCPPLARSRYITSPNTIHHLYHLSRFVRTSGCDFSRVGSIVEWGGGYGNLAKLILRLPGFRGTYTIIDLPILSCVQWLYLATVLGEERVNLVTEPPGPASPGTIDLLPVSRLADYRPTADVFVSTWALSESSIHAQNLVASGGWFGASGLFIGFQASSDTLPHADRVGMLAANAGATIEPLPWQPGNFYAFR